MRAEPKRPSPEKFSANDHNLAIKTQSRFLSKKILFFENEASTKRVPILPLYQPAVRPLPETTVPAQCRRRAKPFL
ncbi:hypothetical protein [Ereboglobus luteus]|uniref:hypothetical protein n=1 Tax=Ereboglobus luteus TaxID=1796921 RepID=UPI001375286B|nr:hypothetical protein [Ereboglobus luteus]